jgi:hypothetical protein
VNPLNASVATTLLERKKDVLTVGLTVRFPALPEAGGLDERSRAIQVVGACLDARGNATRPFAEAGPTRSVYKDEKVSLEHTFLIHMRPGQHTWSLGVRDQATGITSYLSFTTAL